MALYFAAGGDGEAAEVIRKLKTDRTARESNTELSTLGIFSCPTTWWPRAWAHRMAYMAEAQLR